MCVCLVQIWLCVPRVCVAARCRAVLCELAYVGTLWRALNSGISVAGARRLVWAKDGLCWLGCSPLGHGNPSCGHVGSVRLRVARVGAARRHTRVVPELHGVCSRSV